MKGSMNDAVIPHESNRPTRVRAELPIGAPTKSHLLWDGGGCVIAFVCYRWEIPV